jgi:Rad3-related DNA helicase
MSYYDDNFGEWHDMDDPEMRKFYKQVQKESVRKKCQGCGRMVRIRPDYAYCNSCADRIERGMDVG